MAKKRATDPTLSEVLASLGWRHERGHENAQGRIVYDNAGRFLGQLTARDTWELLRERGLIAAVS